MLFVKRLDIFILKNFLTLFAGTFCISLFIVMMQFLWRHIDDLVGKGLSFDVYLKFFFYAGETLVPMALPLAILLASLISFGNIGERLELLAIKAAGISLFRTIRPLIILNILFAIASFHFQNKIAPEAQQEVMKLVYSMREKSPEVDIEEKVFQPAVAGQDVFIYVGKKNKETGMLYDVVIYNLADGVNRAHILLSDSGKIETSKDKMSIQLHLYNGEQFENLTDGALRTNNVPYRRETFVEKHFLFDVDLNFTVSDEDNISSSAMTKNMKELEYGIDSISARCDSAAAVYYTEMYRNTLNIPHKECLRDYDSITIANMDQSHRKQLEKEWDERMKEKQKVANVVPTSSVNIDTLFQKLDPQQQQQIVMNAMQKVGFQSMDIEYKSADMEVNDKQIRRHKIQYWTKITQSLVCLMFFFIGAPLGAIIRKGGLGFPVVIALLIFIVYYIINTFGTKVSKEGSLPCWLGMWLSTIVLMPLGVFFTIKSNNDSAVFNFDTYTNFWRKVAGIRQKRYIRKKEVIIYDPDYTEMAESLDALITSSRAYLEALPKSTPFGYAKYIFRSWFTKDADKNADAIYEQTEYIVEVLSNSKHRKILLWLNGFPVMDTHSFRFYRHRRKDLRAIIKHSEKIKDYIYDNIISVQ